MDNTYLFTGHGHLPIMVMLSQTNERWDWRPLILTALTAFLLRFFMFHVLTLRYVGLGRQSQDWSVCEYRYANLF